VEHYALVSLAAIVSLIASTHNRSGLRVRSEIVAGVTPMVYWLCVHVLRNTAFNCFRTVSRANPRRSAASYKLTPPLTFLARLSSAEHLL
jgi:hypothetical protein